MFWYILSLILLVFLVCCTFQNTEVQTNNKSVDTIAQQLSNPVQPQTFSFKIFDRTPALKRLKEKQQLHKPLVVHVFVPLCDNENQGIVPVNARLGDGKNLQTNLYWGAKYGIKNHFKQHKDWQLVNSGLDISESILERVVFKNTALASPVYLVADAYSGDKMQACLLDYFSSLAGEQPELLLLPDSSTVGVSSEADLLVFNGHNGLMDEAMDYVFTQDSVVREAAVIGCASYSFFKDKLNAANAYPLLTTTNLMAPEAYVLEAVIAAWGKQAEGTEIRMSAAQAYHTYQKCGLKGAKRLFKTGW